MNNPIANKTPWPASVTPMEILLSSFDGVHTFEVFTFEALDKTVAFEDSFEFIAFKIFTELLTDWMVLNLDSPRKRNASAGDCDIITRAIIESKP